MIIMVSLNNIKSSLWSRKTSKRVWRWNGSWKWTYCGRWCKWQNSRSWGWVPDWFEWGQTPLFRRMPKLKWFSNAMFKKEFNIINISDLELLATLWITEITKEVLLEKRIIRKKTLWVKLLADWDLKQKINISVNKASKKAIELIEKLGGKVEIIA